MSWVTNAIPSFGYLHGDDEVRALERVNEFFSLIPKWVVQQSSFFSAEDALVPQYMYPAPRGFVSVKDPSLPRHWYGGTKGLEASLAIGAFNGLDIEGLVEPLCNLCAANMLDPVMTQLILRDREDEMFHVINIDEEMRARGMSVQEAEDE